MKGKKEVVIIVAVVVLVGLALVGAMRTPNNPTAERASPDPSSTSGRPPEIFWCEVKYVAFDAASGELSVDVKPYGKDRVEMPPTSGTLSVAVEHWTLAEPDEKRPACTAGTVKFDRASYKDKWISAKLKVPAECPRESPEGFGVVLAVHAESDGSTKATCSFDARAPAALGGADRTWFEQRQAAKYARAEAEAGAARKTDVEYVTRLAAAMRGLDPTRVPETKTCPANVKGTARVLAYESLWHVSSSADGGLLPAPVSTSTPLRIVGGSKVGEIARENPGLVVLATTTGLEQPQAQFEESTGKIRKGRASTGRYRGGVYVVDRSKEAIVCATTVNAESSGSSFEGTTPTDVTNKMESDFVRQVALARTVALKTIAPELAVTP